MAFSIEMGVPEMDDLWTRLLEKSAAGTLDGDETLLLKKLRKTVLLLAENPMHPGLASHEISDLTKRYGGTKVGQSYLENRKPAAGRLFWVYGPSRSVITIIGLEAHPESGKSRGYQRVKLSQPKGPSSPKQLRER
ncbi:MAG TPA: hypothetical protein VGO11_27045 [Chthoniobacteraceae bacterium]|jgi:hypothetical protein|nr:hypothetical protein [Chthoniobacteraceae bacterium]